MQEALTTKVLLQSPVGNGTMCVILMGYDVMPAYYYLLE